MIFAIIFFVVIVIVVVKSSQNASPNVNRTNVDVETDTVEYVDADGLTQSQRDYLNNLRARRNSQTNTPSTDSGNHNSTCPAVADATNHKHLGTEEHYAPIVGSLGDVDSEGCPSLDGVRLIARDIAYDVKNVDSNQRRVQIAKSMIIGEVLNDPRFKKPYTRK